MRATREASVEELTQVGLKLAYSAIDHGTTSIEIKSGYGLSLEAELNQLRAVKQLKKLLPMHICSTFMGAHDFPPEYKNNRRAYIDIIINEMIPAVVEEGLAEFCDAFIDDGFYTLKEGEEILQAALNAGLRLKVHCDEMAQFGTAELAARMRAISADHLLFVSVNGINAMKSSGTVATLLPGTAYFIRLPYAPARSIIDEGVILALATDCNPGSCFTENMQQIMNLAAINMKMSMEECITAATINGAKALGISSSKGSLEPGKDADFIVCAEESYTDIFYHFGINHVADTWIRGRKVEVK
jgi:imidazolonepropionase